MTLTLTFWISLALSLLKLLEIALSPQQQTYVQDRIEMMVLRLSYIRWSSTYKVLRRRKIQILLAFATLIVSYTVTSFYIMHRLKIPIHLDKVLVELMVVHAFLVITLFPLGVGWLTRGSFKSFIIKAVLVVLAGFLANRQVEVLLDNHSEWWILLFFPHEILVSTCLYLGVYIGLAKLTKGVLLILTKVLWRIVEYPKGAWAAVLFIATAALGILQAFFSTQKR